MEICTLSTIFPRPYYPFQRWEKNPVYHLEPWPDQSKNAQTYHWKHQ